MVAGIKKNVKTGGVKRNESSPMFYVGPPTTGIKNRVARSFERDVPNKCALSKCSSDMFTNLDKSFQLSSEPQILNSIEVYDDMEHQEREDQVAYENRITQCKLANVELERVEAVDETRQSIDLILKGLHACCVCTRNQISGALVILLLQRNFTEHVIVKMCKLSYKLFDVKTVYYGDFLGKEIELRDGDDWKVATIVEYNSFEGFKAVHQSKKDDAVVEYEVGHHTEWKWV